MQKFWPLQQPLLGYFPPKCLFHRNPNKTVAYTFLGEKNVAEKILVLCGYVLVLFGYIPVLCGYIPVLCDYILVLCGYIQKKMEWK